MRRLALLVILALAGATARAQVDSLFAGWNHLDTPGAAVAVIQDGQIVHKRGYGQASLEHHIPITAKTVFDVASVSKQFTAFAVALLVDEGKLALEDDMRQYLPEMPDFGETITIRHLVHHTSGLRDWPGMLAMAGRSMEDVISFDEVLAMARHQKTLNFTPGDQYSYSNTGYTLLALIVERVTGLSFRAYTDRHIFRPLGMVHTWFQDDHEELVANRAYGYRPHEASYRRIGNGLMALGSSSMHTTIDDLILWVLNFDDQRVGSKMVHAIMEQRAPLNGGGENAYAFGQLVGTYRGLRTINHSGSWAGFRSIIMRFPDHDFSIILASNTTDISVQHAFQIADAYLGKYMEAPAATPGILTDIKVSPEEFAGTYDIHDALVVRLASENGILQAHVPAQAPAALSPIGADSFHVSNWNAIVSFERDTDGHVTRMVGLGQTVQRSQPNEDINVHSYAGGYYSMELKVSYSLSVRNDTLMAIGPRGDQIALIPARQDVFVTDSWHMPVIRFKRDAEDQLTHFEASNGRSLRVEFQR